MESSSSEHVDAQIKAGVLGEKSVLFFHGKQIIVDLASPDTPPVHDCHGLLCDPVVVESDWPKGRKEGQRR